jgi:hypothetical protein
MKASKWLDHTTCIIVHRWWHPCNTPLNSMPLWRAGVSTAYRLPIGRRTTISSHVASTVMAFDTTRGIASTLGDLLLLWVSLRPMLMSLAGMLSKLGVMIPMLALPCRHCMTPSHPLETKTPKVLWRQHPMLQMASLSPTSSFL